MPDTDTQSHYVAIEDYLTPSLPNGLFPEKVERNLVFSVNDTGAIWQIRVTQRFEERDSYALLCRFNEKREWTTVAQRKPGDFGIHTAGNGWDEDAFEALDIEYIDIATSFTEEEGKS